MLLLGGVARGRAGAGLNTHIRAALIPHITFLSPTPPMVYMCVRVARPLSPCTSVPYRSSCVPTVPLLSSPRASLLVASVCPPVLPPARPPARPPAHPSTRLPARPPAHPPARLPVRPSVRPPALSRIMSWSALPFPPVPLRLLLSACRSIVFFFPSVTFRPHLLLRLRRSGSIRSCPPVPFHPLLSACPVLPSSCLLYSTGPIPSSPIHRSHRSRYPSSVERAGTLPRVFFHPYMCLIVCGRN
jgi:hypothetical protein